MTAIAPRSLTRVGASLGLLAERFGLRRGHESRFSVLAFDAAMVRTDSLTLVPGVSSKNTTVVSKRDTSAGDGQAEVRVIAAAAGHLTCFAQDPVTQALRRIFPNRFVRDSRVEPGMQVALPGPGRFTIDARQRVACVHAPTDLYNDLPPPLRWGDFDEVRVQSFEQVAQAFSQVAGQPVPLLPAQTVTR